MVEYADRDAHLLWIKLPLWSHLKALIFQVALPKQSENLFKLINASVLGVVDLS